MSGQEAFNSYKLYNALRLHFTTKSYDFIKFRGKTKVDARKFDQRPDRFFYYKLWARHKNELELFYISVFINGSVKWVGELLGEEYHTQFNEMLKRHQALSKVFSDDVKTIVDLMEDRDVSFKQLLVADGANMPMIVRLQEQDFISLETLVIINRLTKMTDKCDCPHPFWEDKKLLITKYEPFVKVGKLGRFASILKDGLTTG